MTYDHEDPVTYDKALELLRKVSAGKEDFVYVSPGDNGCLNYAWDSTERAITPSCIVGHVLNELGWLELVDETDYVRSNQPAGVWRNFTQKALELLSRTQARQEAGTPWGLAIEKGIIHASNTEE